jgi:hypothetical protein
VFIVFVVGLFWSEGGEEFLSAEGR